MESRTVARILIVDGDKAVRCLTHRVLARAGHSALEAGTAAQARRELVSERFDLVLCDITLPDESGLVLVRQIVTELPDTAVVMVTETDEPAVASEAVSLGVVGYLVKPFPRNELRVTVALVLRLRDAEHSRRQESRETEDKVLYRMTALRHALKRLAESESSAHIAEAEVVDRLVMALTLRSEETRGHMARVGRYTALLARRRGLDRWTEEEVRAAAMLHDVGKIGIADAILLKPGPLSESEHEQMRRHAALGATRLAESGSRTLELGSRIALSHHERWDGQGYPAGLAAAAIPAEGRMAAVADVFDALTSDHVYRMAWTVEHALDYMLGQRGRQFDPDLVDLLVAAEDEVLGVRSSFPDPAPSSGISVLLADSRRLFGEALVRQMAAADGIIPWGPMADGDAVVEHAHGLHPDVVVIDSELPPQGGYALVGRLREVLPPTTVHILLTPAEDDVMLLRAIEAGALGIVTRPRAFDDLAAAVASAHAGHALVPSAKLIELYNRGRGRRPPPVQLSGRQLQVLRLLAEGLSSEGIGDHLHLSPITIRNHSQRIQKRLNAHSRLEAVTTAARLGILGWD